LDHERPALWLREVVDPMESEGYVHIPQRQGLEIDWDYIEENRVKIE
jgi:L-alanine-DL-glutamate epimerase-like enolase superfamily enzyme